MKVIVSNKDKSETAEFDIHKNLLSTCSSYFRALPNFSEGRSNVVKLEDMCPQDFQHVVSWMYTRCCPTVEEDCNILIRAWGIADRLMMSTCKNHIIHCIQAYFVNNKVDISHLDQVESLGFTSLQAAARFLKDEYIWQGVSYAPVMEDSITSLLERDTTLAKNIIAGFVFKVNYQLWCLNNLTDAEEVDSCTDEIKDHRLDPADARGCDYHEHDAREMCYRNI